MNLLLPGIGSEADSQTLESGLPVVTTLTSSGSKTKGSKTPPIYAPPEIIASDIVEDLQAALAQFAEIANDLKR